MSSSAATGSVMRQKHLHLCRLIKFHVSETYDEREIEELFETIESRGAFYNRFRNQQRGWYELLVPHEFQWEPFYETLQACSSVDDISNFIEFCGRTFLVGPRC